MSSGGAERQASCLIRLLDRRGYKIRLVTYLDVPDEYPLPTSVERVRVAPGRGAAAKAAATLWRLLRVKADCLISYTQRCSVMALTAMLFRPRVTAIASERNTTDKPIGSERILFGLLYRRADYIVPNSHCQTRYILSKKKIYARKLVTITNYLNLDDFPYQEPPRNPTPRIGVLARYEPVKNLERLAAAVSQLAGEPGIPPFVVEWHGDTTIKNQPNPHYLRYKETVERLGIAHKMLLLPRVSDVAATMAGLDAVCLPSTREGFSNAISEAIACGKVVLASGVSDNPVMVADGQNGFIFNPFSVEEIKTAIRRFLSLTAEEREQMSRRSRLTAESLFAGDKFIDAYTALIEGKHS